MKLNNQKGQDTKLKQYYDVRSGEYMWLEEYEDVKRFKPLTKRPSIFVRLLAKVVSLFRKGGK